MSESLSVQIELCLENIATYGHSYFNRLLSQLDFSRFNRVILSVKANGNEKLLSNFRKHCEKNSDNVTFSSWYSCGEDLDSIFYYARFVNEKCDFLLLDNKSKRQDFLKGFPKNTVYRFDEFSVEKALRKQRPTTSNSPKRSYFSKFKTAMITPLPPMKSGIADYSHELLTALSEFYDIDTFVPSENFDEIKTRIKGANVYNIEDFSGVADRYDRIVYHFGNNPMHTEMFDTLAEYGGVVVLHDFYLSGIQWYRQAHDIKAGALDIALYESHGLAAAAERVHLGDQEIVAQYPCNFEVIRHADAIITHSEYSHQLLTETYDNICDAFQIPLMREARGRKYSKEEARRLLGIDDDSFLVCSFGFTGPTKLNIELISAWNESDIARDDKGKLVFVGQNEEGPYGKELLKLAEKHDKAIAITGWTDSETYQQYLAAADVAVQLRSMSRGETSAAVLDTMLMGIPTIVNANGSFAYLPKDAVIMLENKFELADLTAALSKLYEDPTLRTELSIKAESHLEHNHNPRHCARAYFDVIEKVYQRRVPKRSIASQIVKANSALNTQELLNVAATYAFNNPPRTTQRRLLLDVSVVAEDDFKTGIQRVVREVSRCLISSPPEEFRIELVKLVQMDGQWKYMYAREYAKKIAGIPEHVFIGYESEVLPISGDVFIGLDLAGGYVVNASQQGYFDMLRCFGAKVFFVVYDLIPVQFENIYPPGFKEGHERWLHVVSESDGAICISQTVANDLKEWIGTEKALPVTFFHLGCDIAHHTSSKGLPAESTKFLKSLESSVNFLMVGTVEPRKGHGFVLEAMEAHWQQGGEEKLVIVGKQGWMVESLAEKIKSADEFGHKLIWLEGISDEYLEQVYSRSDCLIAASEGEGFGLPLIEASLKGIPILARDIPIFREVACEYAHYFSGDNPESLTTELQEWLQLYRAKQHTCSAGMPRLNWEQSTLEFKRAFQKLLTDENA